jgi:hypothetical protein
MRAQEPDGATKALVVAVSGAGLQLSFAFSGPARVVPRSPGEMGERGVIGPRLCGPVGGNPQASLLAGQLPIAFQTSADTPLTVSMPYCSDTFPFVSTAMR